MVNSKHKKHATPIEVEFVEAQDAAKATEAKATEATTRPTNEPAPGNGMETGPNGENQESSRAGDRAELTEADVEALIGERDKLKDQLLRTAADFDNFRKRSRRDVEDAKRRGKEETVRELLPVFDSLERSIAAAKDAKDVQSIAQGVQMILKQFEDASERVALKRLASVGERFDPAIHDAVQELETADVVPGTVLAEVLPGYRIGEHLVRAAIVVVARAPKSSIKPGQANDSKQGAQGEPH